MEPANITKSTLLLYTEQTPNPESLKFVSNKMLFQGIADFKKKDLAEVWSPLATKLYEEHYVQSVYISNNFVTITKKPNVEWQDIMIPAKDLLKSLLDQNTIIVKEGFENYMVEQEAATSEGNYDEKDAELVKRIKDMIQMYVKPAVEMDGGNIEFKSFHDGIVTVMMQGSCSGCPSSTVTLKAGIEGLLKRMVPEVLEVVAEAV
ncbi:MAG: NifU family protein [Saprospiraceae bacterium]|nr:NifU family protein [Saprospiraceae bacterium]